MDFYGKLGNLLSEALEKGEIPKAETKDENKTGFANKSEFSKGENKTINVDDFGNNEQNENTEEKVDNIVREEDMKKVKTFTFTQFGQSKTEDAKPKHTFSFEQFAKMNQEAAHTEPKVQIYKFSQLVIPQNVLYALNVIGIPTNADFEAAKRIYREKIMYYHPDKWLGTPYIEQAKTNTQTLNTAWEIVEWWYVAR